MFYNQQKVCEFNFVRAFCYFLPAQKVEKFLDKLKLGVCKIGFKIKQIYYFICLNINNLQAS